MAQSTVVGHEREVGESVKEPVSGSQRVGSHPTSGAPEPPPSVTMLSEASPLLSGPLGESARRSETETAPRVEAGRGLKLNRYFSTSRDPFDDVVWRNARA
jgi:hypothetical protein